MLALKLTVRFEEEEEPSDEGEARAPELARKEIRRQQPNEYEALEEAAPDLIRLERYERRAWSRQKHAIQEFTPLRFSRAIAARFAQNDRPNDHGRPNDHDHPNDRPE